MRATVDHIVLAVPTLKEAAQKAKVLLGRDAVSGGVHEESGTQNLIVPLDDSYLELVTVNEPQQAASHPFGRLVASALADGTLFAGWAARPAPGQAADPEPVVSLTRGATTFQLRGLEAAARRRDVPFFVQRHESDPADQLQFPGRACGSIRAMRVAVPDHGEEWPHVEEGATVIHTVSSSAGHGAIVQITLDDADGKPVTLTEHTWREIDLSVTNDDDWIVQQRQERMVGDRRHLHRIPEVGLQLPQTQAYLLAALEPLGLEVSTGTGLSSITAVLRGSAPTIDERAAHPAVLLRSDMDALPIDEATGMSFASDNGAMHACGHDLHMAILLESARALSARADELAGDVVFAFQPGEENHGGARMMIDEGLYQRPDAQIVASLGLHVLSYSLPAGVLALREGPIMAGSTIVAINFDGRGGHGSAPHRSRDSLHAAAAFVPAVYAALSHDIDMFDPTVLSFGSLHAGNSANVIPDTAELRGTLRTFSADTTARARHVVERVAHAIATAHDVTVEVSLTEVCLPVHNDPDETAETAQAAADAGLPVRWLEQPISVSEDFSYMLQANTGAFALLGAVVEGQDPATAEANHSARAEFNENVLVPAADFMTAWAVRRLRRGGSTTIHR